MSTEIKHVWTPKIGELVKLKHFSDYSNSPGLHIWAWLRVEEIVAGRRVRVQVMNGLQPIESDNQREFPLDRIDPPLGWEPVYTVYVSNVDVKNQLLGWLAAKRGVACWISHDLSSAGRRSFTPGDGTSPHWQYTGNPIEIVHDPARFKFVLCKSQHDKPPKEELKKVVLIDYNYVKLWKYSRRQQMWFKEEELV